MSESVREPVHVVYGGAHLFAPGTVQKVGRVALQQLDQYVPTPRDFAEVFGLPQALAAPLHHRVRHKLEHEPVEDYRIDFEDGYGVRSDAEEDAHASAAGAALAAAHEAGHLPAVCGLRIRPLRDRSAPRGLRTLDLFVTAAAKVDRPVMVTLPKVERDIEVDVLIDAIHAVEQKVWAGARRLQVELMIESPCALNPGVLKGWVDRTGGRCVSVHFGAYDYLSALDIVAGAQSLRHPAAIAARATAQRELYGTNVRLADGATTLLPIPLHKTPSDAAQHAANRALVVDAWRAHFANVTEALRDGFYQGWDLHPGQLVPRYAATFAFFATEESNVRARLERFKAQAERATASGGIFDDAATVRGLEAFLRRGEKCGALNEGQASATRADSTVLLKTGQQKEG